MSGEYFSRSEPLLGKKGLEKVKQSRICLFGAGGVGSYCFEALVRSGIGHMTLVDGARVDATNINRQIPASSSTIGRYKVDVEAERAQDINPEIEMETHGLFVTALNIGGFVPAETDFLIDAVDDVQAKLAIAEYAHEKNIPIISCMGAGNRLFPERLRITDIFSTSEDPLARIMRRELRKRGIEILTVVWSDEKPLIKGGDMPVDKTGKKVPASVSFVPSAAGLLMASHVINTLAGIK